MRSACCRRRRRFRPRPGFSLADVLVALVLLGVAVLSVGGGAAAATGLLREASLTQGAAFAAEAVFDSIAQSGAGTASLVRGPFTLQWTAVDSAAVRRIRLEVRYASGAALRTLRLDGLAAPPPPRSSHAP